MNADDAQVIGLTLGTATLSTLLIFPFGVALAWLLARKEWHGKTLVETVVALPLVMPPVATGLILLNLLGRRGPIGEFLQNVFGTEIVFTWKAVVAAMAVMSFPFLVRTVRLAFEDINPRLEQVARTLGASPLRVFTTITLPLAARGMIAGAVWAFTRALGEFGATILVAGNIPGRTTVCPSPSTKTSSSVRKTTPTSSWASPPSSPSPPSFSATASPNGGAHDETYPQKLQLRLGAFHLEADLEASGQVIGIFGSSGAGKTSLLEIVAGLRKPASGFIAVDDLVLMHLGEGLFFPPERRGVGYVPQDSRLVSPSLRPQKSCLRPQAAAALRRHQPGPCGRGFGNRSAARPLHPRSFRRPETARRFARALLASPRLLLMDEPLASLDQELKWKIIPYLKRIRDEFKIPMLYVSHSPDEVIELCDQVIVMRDGKCLRPPARPRFSRPPPPWRSNPASGRDASPLASVEGSRRCP